MFDIDIRKIPNQNELIDSVVYQVQKMFSYLKKAKSDILTQILLRLKTQRDLAYRHQFENNVTLVDFF